MRPLLVVAVLALAVPSAAAGAGLSLASRELAPAGRAPLRVERFDLVGLHWRGSGSLLFRTRSLGGRWSGWHTAAPEGDDLPDRGTEGWASRGWRIGSPFWTGGAEAIQYRTAGRVTAVRAFFVRSPRRQLPFRYPAITVAPEILTRADWGADESIVRGTPRYADSVQLALVHHTAGSNSYTRSQSPAIVRAIEAYHVKGNGWDDIGYNFLVDRYGQVFEGRAGGIRRAVIGAHAEGFNTGTVGVAVIGSYDSAGITPAAKAALVSLLAWRLDLDHVDPASSVVRISSGNPRYPAGTAVTLRTISGHRDAYPTSCPGASLYAQLPAIRAAVEQTGVPKLYSPAVTGTLGGPIRFTARLSDGTAWAATVRDQNKIVIASGGGIGTSVDWTWDSTAAPPGLYTWTINAPQMRSATGTIGAAPVPLALRQLKIAPKLVSPNGDGLDDAATVTYQLTAPALVTASVLDDLGDTVATLFSQRELAGRQTFVWDGVALPDGRYRFSLLAGDDRGKQVQSRAAFDIDRTLGVFAADTPVFSPNGDGRLDEVTFSYRLYAQAHVRLDIFRGSTIVATPILDSYDNTLGLKEVSWGGRLPDGRYSAILSATDSTMTVEGSVPLRADTKAPTLRLASLRALRLWLSEPARVVFAVNGRWRRLEMKRAGFFSIGHRGEVRGLTAFALDAGGNRSRTVSARR